MRMGGEAWDLSMPQWKRDALSKSRKGKKHRFTPVAIARKRAFSAHFRKSGANSYPLKAVAFLTNCRRKKLRELKPR
jgi:hypothetical protein